MTTGSQWRKDSVLFKIDYSSVLARESLEKYLSHLYPVFKTYKNLTLTTVFLSLSLHYI